MKKSMNTLLSGTITLALSFTGLSAASAVEYQPNSTQTIAAENNYEPEFEELFFNETELARAMQFIENIPDDVLLSGDQQALLEWYDDLPTTRVNWLACGSAIGYAIITNFTPAKILKVKSAIKAVGGAIPFVKTAWNIYKKARAAKMSKSAALKQAINGGAKAAGSDVKKALLELFGITAVMAACGLGE
ncbi:hypothetical protein KJY77_02850 [Canibacter sp. lx-72]|uniref:hypothetical protein n=1 Tax=Canibacter zhuwentaonis TaxID=2837491 RepID=UPI001BDBC5FA|nr:hypothetical protein [Canibacter zhuwentaonis]MBT1018079.1 hypothetical protein [Canibacter zhuwentaonis]